MNFPPLPASRYALAQDIWRRVLLVTRWAVLLGLLHFSLLHAQVPQASGIHTVTMNAGPVPLDPWAQVLIDPSGRLTPDEVAYSEIAKQFKAMPNPLALGFSDSAVWVRWQIRAPVTGEWWLRVEQPLLEDVRLYTPHADGGWREQHGREPWQQPTPGIDARKPTFAVQLGPSEPTLILLRIRSRTSLATNFTLGSPTALSAQGTRESFFGGLLFGAYSLVVLLYAGFTFWTRHRVYATYTGLIFINLAAAFLTDAWNHELHLSLPPVWHTTLLGVFISLAPFAALAFQAQYLETQRRWPQATRLCLGLCGVASAISLVMVLTMHYRQSAVFIQSFSIALALFSTVLTGYLSLQNNRRALLLLLAFGIFYLCVGWRYLRNMGLITPTAINEHAYQIGAFLNMLILSTGIFSGYSRMRHESERQKARAAAETRLRQQQSQFLSLVAHEVKNPLAVISATADNLQITPGMPDSALQRVDKIARNGDKIRDIFQNYLDTQRLLNGNLQLHFKSVDLQALLHTLIREVDGNLANAISLTTPGPVKVMADAQLLSIALGNLLSNAVKYGHPEKGIGVALQVVGDRVQVQITDHGPGVHPKDLPHIFDAYYRGQNALPHQGSGLGLHLVRYIVERHGGHVSARSMADGGMQFTIALTRLRG